MYQAIICRRSRHHRVLVNRAKLERLLSIYVSRASIAWTKIS